MMVQMEKSELVIGNGPIVLIGFRVMLVYRINWIWSYGGLAIIIAPKLVLVSGLVPDHPCYSLFEALDLVGELFITSGQLVVGPKKLPSLKWHQILIVILLSWWHRLRHRIHVHLLFFSATNLVGYQWFLSNVVHQVDGYHLYSGLKAKKREGDKMRELVESCRIDWTLASAGNFPHFQVALACDLGADNLAWLGSRTRPSRTIL
ncbi:hypothetical protein QYF36_000029 [Acer negundo]|nr:hypothetical protein QYF36_000029 [Acer negundo]